MNKYNNLQLLGKGSYGTVYKVKSITNNKIYALKQLDTSQLKSKYDIFNLISELKILSSHNSNYLLKCNEIFYSKNKVNIVTDFAMYSDLSRFIEKYKKRNARISEKTIWIIFIKCCFGIEYLHQNKVIHRDIKPANILLHEQQSVWIADFGVSKIYKEQMYSYTMIGTPYYISPEMFSNKKYNDKVDIWSLGCILYEMCTLEVPFTANNMSKLQKKIMSGVYSTSPLSYYSNDMIHMIKFLLQKSVHMRPNIQDVMKSSIFKKYAREFNVLNLNVFNTNFNKKVQIEYNLPVKTIGWNNLINKIDENKLTKKYEEPNKKYKEPIKQTNKNEVIEIKRNIQNEIIDIKKPKVVYNNNPYRSPNKKFNSKNPSKNAYDVYYYLKNQRNNRLKHNHYQSNDKNKNIIQLPQIPKYKRKPEEVVYKYTSNAIKLPKL